MKNSTLTLAASNVLLGTAVGASLNQSVFVMPGWFSSPPASLTSAQANPTFRKFWIPLQAATALALGAAFALNRRNRRRRGLLAGALGLYVGTWVSTAIYFAPEIIRLGKPASGIAPADIGRRGKRWLGLNWLRNLAQAGAWALSTSALARRA